LPAAGEFAGVVPGPTSRFTMGASLEHDERAAGLAHAGAVDGYVWDTLHRQHPEATEGLRVAWRSGTHGFPPVVAMDEPGKEAKKK
jgi:hypothetical protein